MNVLIIDDSDYKIQSLQALVKQVGLVSKAAVARSFQTGLRAIKDTQPELILLDMTLPTSERQDGRLEGRTRIFGGRDILAEMELDQYPAQVIVVTQFDHFGEPPQIVTLDALFIQLKKSFPKLFIGGVYYSNVDSAWQSKLKVLFDKIQR